MIKFAIFLIVIVASSTNGQDENYEVCADLDDGNLVGFGHDVSCSKYYYCEERVGYPYDCLDDENGYYQFNEETYQCDLEENVNCYNTDPEPETDAPPVETNPPDTQAPITSLPETTVPGSNTDDPSLTDIECPTNQPGEILFFPSSNCSNYFICANGVRLQMTCLEGFAWNHAEKQCDFPIYSACTVKYFKKYRYLKSLIFEIFIANFFFGRTRKRAV